jgi:hypothetical protein
MPSSTARAAVGDSRISSCRSPSMAAIGANRLTVSAGGGGASSSRAW